MRLREAVEKVKTAVRRKPKSFEPWAPPPIELRDVAAIKALQRGDASAEQQRHALKFIVEKACATYELSFCPDENGRRSTDFAEGKRRVGLLLVGLLAADIRKFRDPDAPPREKD
jgi:hypothetical protein